MDKQELDAYRWLDADEMAPVKDTSREQQKMVQKLLDHLDMI